MPRVSEVVAYLKSENAELETYCAALKGALVTVGVEILPRRHPLLLKLTPQQASLVGILFRVYPRSVHVYDLIEMLPSRSDLPGDRDAMMIRVLVTKVRAVMGVDAINSLPRGESGYTLGERVYQMLREDTLNFSTPPGQ